MTPAPAPDPQATDQQADPQDPRELYGERFENLPEQLVNALREQVKEFQGQEKYLRRREVMRDRRARFYELTPRGRKQLGEEVVTWRRLVAAIDRVIA